MLSCSVTAFKSLSKFIENSNLTAKNCTLSSALGVVEPASTCFDLSLETDQMTTYTETRIVSGRERWVVLTMSALYDPALH